MERAWDRCWWPTGWRQRHCARALSHTRPGLRITSRTGSSGAGRHILGLVDANAAGGILGEPACGETVDLADVEAKAMNSIVNWWTHLTEHSAFWDAFWPAVWGALIGAGAAFLFEGRRRRAERIANEVGQCNKLIFVLGQMLSSLQDIRDFLDSKREQPGGMLRWDELGAMEGAPGEGPAFIIGEYTFLLESENPKSAAPYVLGRIYTAESNFKATLARLHQRNQLWHQYNELRAGVQFLRGGEAVAEIGSATALTARLKELTRWLEQDVTELIPLFREVIPQPRTVLEVRYPGRQFLRLWPNDDPKAPPI